MDEDRAEWKMVTEKAAQKLDEKAAWDDAGRKLDDKRLEQRMNAEKGGHKKQAQ